MYLVPYIAIALVFFGAMVICLRTRATAERFSLQGIAARGALTVLMLCIVAILWKYVTVETFEAKQWDDEALVLWVRIISAALFVGGTIEVWTDHKTGEL